MDFSSLSALALGMVFMPAAAAMAQDVVRKDRFVERPSGDRIFVREVRRADARDGASRAVLLVHGARVPGIGSFDLPVPGGSLAADIAAGGYAVYLLDLQGYGRSSRPAAMEAPPEDAPPLVRTADAVADIAAVAEAISGWSGDPQISLLGWATGGHWAGAYASSHPDQVESLIVYNSLYGGSSSHPTLGKGSPLEDPEKPGTFNAASFGGYRLNTRASLFTAWDNSIPGDDKAAWRDPAVAAAYADAALASDESSANRNPPTFRSPSGAMADSFKLALDQRQWQASDLTMPVLVIRSANDFWSRPEDARTLAQEAPRSELVEIEDATHFVHLDRDSSGRAAFLSAVLRFLDASG
jgi:pimeloyl-ACP methyl ester carboxylesterase